MAFVIDCACAVPAHSTGPEIITSIKSLLDQYKNEKILTVEKLGDFVADIKISG